jgi:hypothetical protein
MILVTGLRQHPVAEADYVIDELNRRGLHFFRFNLDEYPVATDLAMYIGCSAADIGQFAQRGKSVPLEAISAAWFYSPVPVDLDNQLAEESQEISRKEAAAALDGLWQASGWGWVNPPLVASRAANRLLQMHKAKELGFNIPASLISNDPKEAQDFMQSTPDVILKDLDTPYTVVRSQVYTSFTKRIAELTSDQLEAVALGPCLFQERIPKAHEIRVYVVGDTVIAVGIAPLSDDVGEDYRRQRYQIEVWPYSLPSKVKERCLALVSALGLQYAGIDLLLTPQGEIVFLELGPYSSWVWAEELGGLPLTKTFTDLLEQLAC